MVCNEAAVFKAKDSDLYLYRSKEGDWTVGKGYYGWWQELDIFSWKFCDKKFPLFIYIRILFMYAVLRNTFTEGGELGNQFKYIGLTGAVN